MFEATRVSAPRSQVTRETPRKARSEKDSRLGWSTTRSASQFAPGDELDVLLAKQLAKFGAGEEIEITPPPCGAPRVTLASSGFHFVVGEGEVNHEFGHAGGKVLERG